MVVGIKYCGGCNNRYDRKEAVTQLQERHRGSALVLRQANEEEVYDFLLVVCGCERACASYKQYSSHNHPILLWEEKQFDQGGPLHELERAIHRQADNGAGSRQAY